MTPERAANLLRDEEFNLELDKLEQYHVDVIKSSQIDDIDKRENAYKMIIALQSIRSHFESIAKTTDIAQKRWKIF
jgi:hypothetical protein